MIKKYIDNKNKGKEYSYDELKEIVIGYTKGEITDKVMTGFLKSVFEHGMTNKATSELTEIMMHSGVAVDLSPIEGIKVDKHSTGGVGDKVTLIVSPIVASLGAPVAKMSGRGLGFTGGTIDKLESIPGYKVDISVKKFIDTISKHGMAVIAQTEGLVPADKKMYALRDETNLIASLPLIASSIMSKKLAVGADAILLDVKCGDAAFMKTETEAKKLAKLMISLGKFLNKDVRAEITSMNRPLGRAIGNKIEVLEAISCLKGDWPSYLKDVVYSSASTMLVQCKIFKTEKQAIKAIDETISSGKALEKFNEWIKAQGGKYKELYKEDFWKPKYKYEYKAEKAGYMNITSAVNFGIAAMNLGAGRKKKEDNIDFDAGIYLNKKTGEKVGKDEVVFSLFSSNKIKKSIIDSLSKSFEIKKVKPKEEKLLIKLK